MAYVRALIVGFLTGLVWTLCAAHLSDGELARAALREPRMFIVLMIIIVLSSALAYAMLEDRMFDPRTKTLRLAGSAALMTRAMMAILTVALFAILHAAAYRNLSVIWPIITSNIGLLLFASAFLSNHILHFIGPPYLFGTKR